MTAWPELKEILMKSFREELEGTTANALALNGILFFGQIYLVPGFASSGMAGLQLLIADKQISEKAVELAFQKYSLNPQLPQVSTVSLPIATADHREMKSYILDKPREDVTRTVREEYYTSEIYEKERRKFEEYLESHKEYFQAIADPEGRAEIAAEKAVVEQAPIRKAGTVLLLGGSGFFGEAATAKFRENGYDVLIGDLKEPSFGNLWDTEYHHVDVISPESLTALRGVLEERASPVTHIINLVGGLAESGLTNIFETSAEEIDRTIERNFKSQIFPVRFLGEYLAKLDARNKSFILMSSINAQAGYSIPFYSAAKGGLDAFVRPAAVDLGRYGVRINKVASGTVRTPSTEQQPKDFEARREAAPLKRLTTAHDVAEAFLSCVRMEAFTGQTLIIDCGQSVNPSESLYDQRRHFEVK